MYNGRSNNLLYFFHQSLVVASPCRNVPTLSCCYCMFFLAWTVPRVNKLVISTGKVLRPLLCSSPSSTFTPKELCSLCHGHWRTHSWWCSQGGWPSSRMPRCCKLTSATHDRGQRGLQRCLGTVAIDQLSTASGDTACHENAAVTMLGTMTSMNALSRCSRPLPR